MSQRTGLTGEEARAGAGAVLAALSEALPEEGYRHLTGQLPAEYTRLAQSASDRASLASVIAGAAVAVISRMKAGAGLRCPVSYPFDIREHQRRALQAKQERERMLIDHGPRLGTAPAQQPQVYRLASCPACSPARRQNGEVTGSYDVPGLRERAG